MRSATALTLPSTAASLLTWVRMALIIGGTGAASAIIFIARQIVEHGFRDLNVFESPLKDPNVFLTVWGVFSCWAVCGQLSYVYTHDVVAQLRRNKEDMEDHEIKVREQLNARINELEQKIAKQMDLIETLSAQTKQLLLILGQEIKRSTISPYLNRIWSESLAVLGDVASGTVVIQGKPGQIWSRYVDFFTDLKDHSPDAEFLATCVIPNDRAGIRGVFESSEFAKYCKCSYERTLDASTKATTKKIFILDAAVFNNMDSAEGQLMMGHFREVDKVAQYSNGRLQIRIASWDDVERQFSGQLIESDFMIWGNALVVHSMLGWDRTLRGVELCVVEARIALWRDQFSRCFECGQLLSDWLQKREFNNYKAPLLIEQLSVSAPLECPV
jgi:hypothetical protein